jgi:hypothetical protein
MQREIVVLAIFLIIILIIVIVLNCWLIYYFKHILCGNRTRNRNIIHPVHREIEMVPIQKYVVIQNPEHISIGIEYTD